MTDIFISYANDDIDRIIPIVKALEDLAGPHGGIGPRFLSAKPGVSLLMKV